MNANEFLYSYLNNASPTGFEASGQKIWLDYIQPFIDEKIIDTYGTAVGVINPGQPYKVVIEAHADEISWFVNYIDDNGYLFLRRNGGSDALIAPSMRANIHTKDKVVKGIFGWPAIHVRDIAKDKAPAIADIFIDCGASNKKEVEEMGIHVGTVVTFEDGLMELNGKYLVGRALDNRIGGYMIAEVAKRLKENKITLPYTLYVVNSVQEEIGLRGAEKTQGDMACGKGPVICYGPAVQNNVRDFIIDVATENKIDFQRQAVSRSTGTDTDSFAYATEGVASALISLPLKYMHTTVETIAKDDMNAVIDLIYQCLLKVKGNEDWRYFN